ncbi:phosphodiesterase [Mycobacterium sp. 1423905.2]|uniref:phosphodiesterase n=1 Tax=Mycobacterium sp. 1423905.2 TaxID=1856859 RepID=UPI000800EBD3|nr:phosphodiesterase [Mycobacterium sp. 1423905.2]OBJ55577.1 phosphodiesterase [Mycobacterium sp. 1423905.2]
MNVSDIVTLPFQWGSALRGRRFFHPAGVIATGSIERDAPEGKGLPIPSSDVVVRVSKATGTPGSLPDFIGLAIRVPSGHDDDKPWDILLVSAGSGVLTRAVALRPVTSWTGQNMTTLMPLNYQGNKWWLRARIETDIDGKGVTLDDVRRRIEAGGIQITLDQACGSSDFEKVARLTLNHIAGPWPGNDVSFDPVLNTAPGVKLYPGWLADLRASAYARSRGGREAD